MGPKCKVLPAVQRVKNLKLAVLCALCVCVLSLAAGGCRLVGGKVKATVAGQTLEAEAEEVEIEAPPATE